jgi:iturin family lipopeptide synthetase A
MYRTTSESTTGTGGTARKHEEKKTGLEIAVIGMAARFPGARHIQQFWENLKNGVESLPFFAEQELAEAGVPGDLLENPGFVKTRGGVLHDKEYFDAPFFGYTPQEAELLNPQTRLFYQCTWEALENAGYNPFIGDQLIGIYAGAAPAFYWKAMSILTGKSNILGDFGTSLLTEENNLCTRLSYHLDLKGPAVVVQSTCSTSLVAIHMACQALLNGECDIALAGGVTVKTHKDYGYVFQEGMILSPDGHCRAFDAKAKGIASGEGVGVVVLKQLEHAIEDGDYIHAVVKGTAINNDGIRRVGYTAPSVVGQAQVIQMAQQVAEVEPESITYVETHGTGTILGDPVEIKALTQAFNTTKQGYCAIGSVKTNVGHLDRASGVASFIKTVLALQYRLIPPSLHFETPNPNIDFENSPFYVNTQLREWKNENYPLRAGVSSFGIGGTNAHVILEEVPEGMRGLVPSPSREYQLMLLSAKTPSALDRMTGNLAEYLTKNPGLNLADVAYTLQVGRRALQHRSVSVCSTLEECFTAFTSSRDSGRVQTNLTGKEDPPVVFMFPGLGAQYVNMGLELYQKETVFREETDRCFDILSSLVDYDIKKILYPHPDCRGGSPSPPQDCVGPPGLGDHRGAPLQSASNSDQINHIEIAQLVVFIFEYALAKLLMKWGIKPGAMIGYSFGEYAAACLSGVFSLEETLKLVVYRGELLQKIPPGAMLSVPMSKEELMAILPGNLSLSIDNGPSCIVSGFPAVVADFEKEMKKQRYLTMRLPATRALHSHMMEPILKEFAEAAAAVTGKIPQTPYLSNVTGKWITPTQAVAPGYWAQHLRQTVRFSDGIKELLKDTDSILVEIGPGRDLAALAVRHLEDNDNLTDQPYQPYQRIINLARPAEKNISDLFYLVNKLGRLWLSGVSIDWSEFHAGEKRYRLPLTTYPFEGQRHWIDGTFSAAGLQKPKQVETPGKKPDLADWFYLPTWTQADRVLPQNNHSHREETHKWLLFLEEQQYQWSTVSQLVNRLKKMGHQMVTVTPGLGFGNAGQDHYTINPKQLDDYFRLFAAFGSPENFPDRVIHLLTLTGNCGQRRRPGPFPGKTFEKEQDSGFYSILNMVKAIGKQQSGKQFRLNVISDNLQEVSGEEVLQPGKATILGLLKVIPQEHPNIRCRSIDVVCPQPGSWQQEALVELLLEEITGNEDISEPVVAFRGHRRWVQTFKPLHLEEVNGEKLPLKEKGVYLITGGLGEIGLILAQFLAKQVKARLILTGRSPLPPREQWQEYKNKQGDPVGRKVKKILELEAMGAEVLAFSADAAHMEQMRNIIGKAGERFGPINGVIHAAGLVKDSTFKTLPDIGKTEVEQQFQAKVYGTLVLEKLFRDRTLDFCWLISSISTVLGGLQFAAYASANAFMDALAQQLNRSPGTLWCSIGWDGMAPEDTAAAFKRISTLRNITRVAVSKGGNLQNRINRWVKMEYLQEEKTSFPRPALMNPYVAPSTKEQEILAHTWKEIFGYDRIGIQDDFIELGGDSLKAITVISNINRRLHAEVPLVEFFARPTIEKLTQYIENAKKTIYSPLKAAEEKEYYAVTPAQRRLYFLQQMNEECTAYNETETVLLTGSLDREKLEQAVSRLILRHEILRTSIHMVNQEPVQKVHRQVDFQVGYHEVQDIGEQEENIINDLIRPFDLSRAPYLRVGLVKVGDHRHALVVDKHHIVTDGVSHEMLVKELTTLYSGEELPVLEFQYKDYARWHHTPQQQAVLRSQGDFWLKQFQKEPQPLNLPIDYARPSIKTFAATSIAFGIGREHTRQLKRAAVAEEATSFMILLAILNVLLAKITGQDDIIIGTGVVGRRHPDLWHIMGIFVNTLVIRSYTKPTKTFREFLKEVKTTSLQAFENQEYPFEDLVDQLALKRDTSRNPLFDLMFVQETIGAQTTASPSPASSTTPPSDGLLLEPHGFSSRETKFDLTIYGKELNEEFFLSWEYCKKLFKQETIHLFITYFQEILSSALADPGKQLSELQEISKERKEEILFQLNNQLKIEKEKISKLNNILQDKLKESLNKFRQGTAIEYMSKIITFGEVDKRSDYIANWMINRGMQKETFIGILIDNRAEFIIAMIGILKAGCVFVPLDPALPPGRLKDMISFVDVKLTFTDTVNSNRFLTNRDFHRNMEEISEFVVMDDWFFKGDISRFNRAPGVQYNPEDKIYIYFTSGTTGTPRAMLGKNKSLLHFINWEIHTFSMEQTFRLSQLTSPGFDAFLRDVFVPLCSGGVICIPGTKAIVQNAPGLVKWIEKSRIRLIHCVPALFRLLTSAENLGKNSFKNLKFVLMSGEKINPPDLVSWYNIFKERIQLVNLWGTSETTLAKTCYFIRESDIYRERIPVGKPIPGARAVVLAENLKICDRLVVGEIYIQTGFRTYGYLDEPMLNRQRFIQNPFSEDVDDLFHKTGDLGRILPEGDLDVLGRNDRQVKIRGIRIELEEIESLLVKYKRVKEAVVVKREISTGNELLTAYVVVKDSGENKVKEEFLLTELEGYLTGKLPAYMVPASIMLIEELPRTSRGKVDYDALPEPFAQQEDSYAPPRDELEKSLCSLWSEILGMDIEKIGITHRFFEWGGNSLNAMALISKIHKAFNVKFPLVEIFVKVTIDEQAEFIRSAQKERYADIEAAEKKEYYELSSAQKRIFFLHQMEPGSRFYNMPRTMVLQGGVDKERIEKTFIKLINRHESFRTSFQMMEGTPIQRIHRDVPFGIDCFEAEEDPDEIVKRYIRPFDLSRAPVLRVGIVHTSPAGEGHPPGEGNPHDMHILIVEMHHIISDGTSLALFVKDFMALYKEDRLPPLRVQYKDFSEWRNSPGERQTVMHQEAFWLKEFEGDIPVLNLPTDYARPLVRRFEGAGTELVIEAQKLEELKTLALKEEVTMFMLLLAIFNILLSKLSGQEDIIVGSGIEGRRHEDLRQIIGMFVNTLSLRNYPRKDKTFLQFLGEVKQRMLAAFENQEYQFEELVEKVVVNRDTSRNPLFDITFQMENFERPTVPAAPGIGVRPYRYEKNISKFDLTLKAIETGDFLLLPIEYNTSLFEPETIERFKTYFQDMVSMVLADPGKKLWEIGKISKKRKEEFLFHLNEELDNEVKIINNYQYHTIQDKLINALGLFKNHIAIAYGDRYLTNSQLDNRSDYIARGIIRKGITKQTLIGIMIDDRMEFITAIIGILKTGCIFIPLDMEQPESRLEMMIRSTNIKYIISDGTVVSQWWEPGVTGDCSPVFMSMDDLFASPVGLEEKPLWHTHTPGPGKQYGSEDQIYIYFTSGSTGTPRGVVGKNRSFLHFIDWEIETLAITNNYRFSQLITPGFDPFLRDIFVPLCTGGVICIPPGKEIVTDSPALIDWIEKSGVRLIHCVPSLFRLFNAGTDTYSLTNRHFKELKYILLSGEPIHPSDLVRWYETFDERIQLVNLWGPTETTLAKTCYFIGKSDIIRKRIPVGKPIYGSRVVILDRENNICDELVEGEKYIITPYGTFGYCNDPELTNDRFLPNPFNDKPEVRMYKTGDLGRSLPGGNLDILGRNDRQVKIRGMRLELEEIESLLARHKLVNAAVVVKREISVGSELLCAYVEIKAGDGGEIGEESPVLELEGYLTGKLPAYMVPAGIMVMEKIPRNSRGKVDYNSLPDPLTPGSIEYVPPSTDIEQGLSGLWSQILGIEKIGITSHFFKLGGNSLNAMALVLKIRKNFDIEFPLVEIFSQTTIEKQAAFIKSAKKQAYVSIEPVEEKEYYELSSAQKRIYFLQQMEPGSTSYNMHITLVLEGNLQKKRMEEAFRMLIQRHENFRTSFEMIDNTPVQRIHQDKNLSFAIVYFDPHEKEVDEIVKAFTTPFDLSQAPLLKVGLIKTGISTHILMVEIHHIISDAVSMTILREDFTALQGKGNLPRLRLHYKDYSQWQNSEKQTKLVEKQKEYWLRVFAGEVPILNLPLDYPRPEVQDFEGDRVYFNTGKEKSLQLKEFALEKGVTIFMLCLAIFNILLHKLTGQEDLIVGTDTAGRGHADLQNVIGMFANTLALRNYPAPDKTFVTFLEEIKKRTLEAFENQDYQFERIVEQVVVNRDMSRNPLFDTAFNFFNARKSNPADIPGTAAPGLIQKPYSREDKTSKFDLTLIVRESEDYLFFTFGYCTKLFKKEKIEAFAIFFEEIVSAILENPQITLGALEISLQLLAAKKEEVRLDELDF